MVWACEEKRGNLCRKMSIGKRMTREKGGGGKTKEKVFGCN